MLNCIHWIYNQLFPLARPFMWLGDPFVHFSVSCSLSQVFHHGSPRILSPHSQRTSFPRHQIMPPLTILHSRDYHVSSKENGYATRSLPHFLPLFPTPKALVWLVSSASGWACAPDTGILPTWNAPCRNLQCWLIPSCHADPAEMSFSWPPDVKQPPSHISLT